MLADLDECGVGDVRVVVEPTSHRCSESCVVEQTGCSSVKTHQRPSRRQPLLKGSLSVVGEDLVAVGEEHNRLVRRELVDGEKVLILRECWNEEVRVVGDPLNSVDGSGDGGVSITGSLRSRKVRIELLREKKRAERASYPALKTVSAVERWHRERTHLLYTKIRGGDCANESPMKDAPARRTGRSRIKGGCRGTVSVAGHLRVQASCSGRELQSVGGEKREEKEGKVGKQQLTRYSR
jgi:hypothetical protein